jgi:hypothetical protein
MLQCNNGLLFHEKISAVDEFDNDPIYLENLGLSGCFSRLVED